MSIVPKEVVASIAAAWNLECGETFAAHIANRAAQWALEQAAKVALKEAQDRFIYETYTQTMADAMVDAIRALISPEGKIKGGESDGKD
jgi:hypothetical protein